MAALTPRGIRKRVTADGSIRWQVRYLVRDAASPSGWVETSSTFGTLREARYEGRANLGVAAAGLRKALSPATESLYGARVHALDARLG